MLTAAAGINSKKTITNKRYNQRKLNLRLLKAFLVKENPTNVYLQYDGT
jgi:hypothetical protein